VEFLSYHDHSFLEFHLLYPLHIGNFGSDDTVISGKPNRNDFAFLESDDTLFLNGLIDDLSDYGKKHERILTGIAGPRGAGRRRIYGSSRSNFSI
jgi:hypothetical protein